MKFSIMYVNGNHRPHKKTKQNKNRNPELKYITYERESKRIPPQ